MFFNQGPSICTQQMAALILKWRLTMMFTHGSIPRGAIPDFPDLTPYDVIVVLRLYHAETSK